MHHLRKNIYESIFGIQFVCKAHKLAFDFCSYLTLHPHAMSKENNMHTYTFLSLNKIEHIFMHNHFKYMIEGKILQK